MTMTYLTTKELSERIKYDERTIRDQLKDSVLINGKHYFYPFGGRKILYIWERIEADMLATAGIKREETIRPEAQVAIQQVQLSAITSQASVIPMANGGVCHG